MDTPDMLDLVPGPATVGAAMSWLEALAERDAWPPRLAMGLTLSVDEALTNVTSYAFAERDERAPAPYVRLIHERLPDAVRVTILDNGIAFDPTSLAEPQAMTSIEEARIGGHGVQLMRHYLSRLVYARENGQNRFTLEMAWPAT